MKRIISNWLFGIFIIPLGSFAQRNLESSFPISVVTMDEIQDHRRVSIDLSTFAVFGKQADFNNPGVALRGQYRFGNKVVYPLTKMDLNAIPASAIDRIKLIQDRPGTYMTPDQITKVINKYRNFNAGDTTNQHWDYFGQVDNDSTRIPTGMYMSYFTPQKINYHLEGGYNIFLGKEQNYSGGNYKYDNFSIVTLNGGLSYNPCFNGEVELEAGPAMAIFQNGSEFGFNISLEGYFHLGKAAKEFGHYWENDTKKTGLSAGVGLEYYNLSGLDGFFTAGVGIRMQF